MTDKPVEDIEIEEKAEENDWSDLETFIPKLEIIETTKDCEPINGTPIHERVMSISEFAKQFFPTIN
ncbi:MAG: hypothetical protein Q8936_14145 [Bacillota bacterium]|nr:hypothetical protein [Bacillota bacterium]